MIDYDSKDYITSIIENQIKITNNLENTEQQFRFDKIIESEIDQDEFYKQSGVGQIIESTMQGYNGFVFAYG